MPGKLIPCPFGTLVNTTDKRPPGYSHGVRVDLKPGSRLYVSSGTTDLGDHPTEIRNPMKGSSEEDRCAAFLAQFNGALANIVEALKLAGGDPTQIFKIDIFCAGTTARYFETPPIAAQIGPIWLRHFGRQFPAVFALGVECLVNPEALVEVQIQAVIPPTA